VKNVVVCDIDESRVRELRDQRFDAVQGDISDPGSSRACLHLR